MELVKGHLRPWQVAALKRVAEARDVPVDLVIREAVDTLLAATQ